MNRRNAIGIGIGGTAALLGLAPGVVNAQSSNGHQPTDARAIADEIRAWRDDPANTDFFTVVRPAGRGSLRLPPSDPRVIQAADFLANMPRDRTPIDLVRYMVEHLPGSGRMEWPRDRPGNPQPANPIIVAFFAATKTYPDQGDQTAWCAAMTCWVMQRAGLEHPRSAGSRAFRGWGTEVARFNRNTKRLEGSARPQVGDLAVFQSKGDPVHGHVGFFDGFTDATEMRIFVVGGNQSDQINRVTFPLDGSGLVLTSFRTALGLRRA